MSTKTMKNAIALGAAGILGVGGAFVIITTSSSWAMPVLSNTSAVRTAASIQVTDVRYYRHGYYGRGYGYPYWGNPYFYSYSYPYPLGYGWSGWQDVEFYNRFHEFDEQGGN